ncbi:MAG: hypothetical protein KIS85_03535 [Anaerolineales bacterium]|nr:hypothetical protein [Anaerolineales bacterium]
MGTPIKTGNVLEQPLREDLFKWAQEAMEQARHCQRMRAMYVNFYITLYTASVAGLITMATNSNIEFLMKAYVAWFIGLFIFISGLFSISRSERWTAHFWHNYFIFKRLRSLVMERQPEFKEVFRNGATGLFARDQFSSYPWAYDKGNDTLIAMLCSASGALPYVLFQVPNLAYLQITAIVIILSLPLAIWRSESKMAKAKHHLCCFAE